MNLICCDSVPQNNGVDSNSLENNVFTSPDRKNTLNLFESTEFRVSSRISMISSASSMTVTRPASKASQILGYSFESPNRDYFQG